MLLGLFWICFGIVLRCFVSVVRAALGAHAAGLAAARRCLRFLVKSCNQCVQLGAIGGHGSGERKSKALQQLDCGARIMHQSAVFWVSSFAMEC